MTQQDVRIIKINNCNIVHIHVPKASRKQKPIFIKGNPLKGTFIRLHEGDFRCKDESVKRMLTEQIEDSRDERILKNFNLDDIDLRSLTEYKQMFVNSKPDHPWNDHSMVEFMRCIKGWGKYRETGEEGLTLAGLLMFGRQHTILEAIPNYFLDYQERAEAENRWVDRVTLDGTWSGNLFDFYKIVIRKLTSDLKIPFRLEDGLRIDDTPIHEALREALVNTLVHSDFTGRVSVLVVKRPDMFGFRNPGLMRISTEQAIRGGISDCRNRIIHQMFLMIGLGERAGSGIPKIFTNWKTHHWRQPSLYEKKEPDQTIFELRMEDLLPPQVVGELRENLGENFDGLSPLEQIVLVTARVERSVNHARTMEITEVHPHDLTIAFGGLVKAGFLESSGSGKGTYYHLPGTGELDFGLIDELNTEFRREIYKKLGSKEGPEVSHLGPEVSDKTQDEYDPVHQQLLNISKPIREKKKAPSERVTAVILDLCTNRYLSHKEIANLLGRSSEFLRKEYLNPMVKSKKLEIRYPTKPNHPNQAYRARK